MRDTASRFRFATAPVSWGIGDRYDASWEQPYEKILDEIVEAGYTGTELGPYGYLPTDAEALRPVLARKGLRMLSSFVPVALPDAGSSARVISHIRKVGRLLADLGAPCIVLADEQSPARERIAGRVPADGSASLSAVQWRVVGMVAAEAARVASGFGLDIVFHPHVATFVETPAEVERFFDAVSATNIGLCLDTGHCYYGGGNPVEEAGKYRRLLRYIHIKDINQPVLDECNRKQLDFSQAVEAGVFSQIGKGCLDFPAFFARAAGGGYSGWCVVEQDIKFGASAVPPKISMGASLKYLHSVVEALQHERTAG